ncbi:hypothetical protein NUACC26_064310 [Scytonema sp. NUACC26]
MPTKTLLMSIAHPTTDYRSLVTIKRISKDSRLGPISEA